MASQKKFEVENSQAFIDCHIKYSNAAYLRITGEKDFDHAQTVAHGKLWNTWYGPKGFLYAETIEDWERIAKIMEPIFENLKKEGK